jgi:hypothetical protein
MFSLTLPVFNNAVVSNLSKNFTPNLTFNACRCTGSDPCDSLSLHHLSIILRASFFASLSRRLRWGCKGNHFSFPTKSFLKIYSIYFSDIEILIIKYYIPYSVIKFRKNYT